MDPEWEELRLFRPVSGEHCRERERSGAVEDQFLETCQRREETREQRGMGLKTEFQKGFHLGQQERRTTEP